MEMPTAISLWSLTILLNNFVSSREKFFSTNSPTNVRNKTLVLHGIKQLQEGNGNESVWNKTQYPNGSSSTAYPIYINRKSEEISRDKTIFIPLSWRETNHNRDEIKSVTHHDWKSTTPDAYQTNRNGIESTQESIIVRVQDSTSTENTNEIRHWNYSQTNEEVKSEGIRSLSIKVVNDTINYDNDKMPRVSGAIGRNESSSNENSTAFTISTSESGDSYLNYSNKNSYTTDEQKKRQSHHKAKNPYNHRYLRHLNLVPLEDGPFGTLIWKDRKYLISVLVPIGIGIMGAGCIISMAYVIRFCHKNERRIHEIKETLHEGRESRNDQVILLDESDGEL